MKIIENELQRRQDRIRNAVGNDVWEYRTEPPKEWNRPLPEHLGQKKMPQLKENDSRCAIS